MNTACIGCARKHGVWAGASTLSDRAWAGVVVVEVLGCGTAVTNVGNEHLGKRGGLTLGDFGSRGVSLLLSSGNLGSATIHVELSVSDLVQPRPCDGILTRRDAVGNGILEGGGTGAIRIGR